MTCPSCGHANPAGAHFCNGCGTTLESLCPRCGKPNPPGSRFCNACGGPLQAAAIEERVADPRSYTPKHLAEKILTSRSALEGERKQVTVLFADVKGSMDLAEQIDPEEWHKILNGFFQILTDGVHRFEGTVNQYTGDGIMALFGAPIAHEDHAQRACYAALHLKDELRRYAQELKRSRGLSFSVRMGLNSGEVVVGKIGDDLRMDYTAQGQTVGLAARMEQLAAPGSAYLTEQTAKLVSGFFELRDLGRFEIKGMRDPVRVHELEGVGRMRTRLEVSNARGFSKFVGRQSEMAALEAALEQAIAGNAQVVGVVAEPGTGKSRLCYEFTQQCRARGIRVHEGHGVAHGKMIPFLPVLQLLRGYFGITEQDSDHDARGKITGELPLDEAFKDALPLLFEFLGVPDRQRPAPHMDPEARQRQLFEALRRLTHARSHRELAVILLEDLHWIDGGSEAFLENMVDALPATRTLLVVNFRPEYHAGWTQKSYYQQLPLLPLGAAAIAEMLTQLLGNDRSLVGLAAQIRERTRGNPFFIEEVMQSLAEGGTLAGVKGAYQLMQPIDEVTIPATVQAVLAARIDRLVEREKLVLQTAAVIGKEFAESVLACVADLPAAEVSAGLRALVAAEFVYAASLSPQAIYAFKHPLTQEVAYRSQLAERRAHVHGRVACAIEALYPNKLDERAALLAFHWEGAGEKWTAAQWHRRAADWIAARDRREMDRHWQRVRTLLADVPETQDALALGVLARRNIIYNGYVFGRADDEATALFTEGMDLATRLDDPGPRVRLLNAYANARLAAGAMDEALAHLRESLRLAEQTRNDFLRFIARVPLSNALAMSGRLREGLALSEEAGALGRDAPALETEPGASPYLLLLDMRAQMLAYLGRLQEADQTSERVMDVARARKDEWALRMAHVRAVNICELTGDGPRALAYARRAMELMSDAGEDWGRVRAFAALGLACLLNGQWREAIEAMSTAVGIRREVGVVPFGEVGELVTLAEAHLGAGDAERAREAVERALTMARQRGLGITEIRGLLAHARVLLAADGAAAAAEIATTLRDALALVQTTEAHAFAPFIHVERAELARLNSDDVARQRELREAHRLFIEIGAPIRAEEVARELAG